MQWEDRSVGMPVWFGGDLRRNCVDGRSCVSEPLLFKSRSTHVTGVDLSLTAVEMLFCLKEKDGY